MKILVVGNANSFWIKEYVEYVLLNRENEIYIASKSVTNKLFKDFYIENNIKILNTDRGSLFFDYIPKVRTLVNMLKKVKREYKKGMFDVIHIHSVPSNFMIKFLDKKIVKYARSVVCTYWGSDLLSKSKNELVNATSCLEKAKHISYSSDGMDEYFHKIFSNKYDDKIIRAKFGISIYDVINKVKKEKTKEECKEVFSIDKNKISVMIGYNGNMRQHHIDVIKEIAKLKSDITNKMILVVQLSYGLSSDEYRQEILNELSKINIEYVVIDDFLDKEKSAMLRIATDIFIHAQESDAFSASIQECVYSGSILINPIWIKYKEFDELDIDYITYDSYDEIGVYINDIISKKISMDNSKKVHRLYDKYSWQAVKNDWLKLYS